MAVAKEEKTPRKKPERRPTVFSASFMSALGNIGREMAPLTDDEKRSIVKLLSEQFGTDGEA